MRSIQSRMDAAEFDFSAAGPYGLGLEVEQDHPGSGTVGHAVELSAFAGLQRPGSTSSVTLCPFFSQACSSGSRLCGRLVRQNPV